MSETSSACRPMTAAGWTTRPLVPSRAWPSERLEHSPSDRGNSALTHSSSRAKDQQSRPPSSHTPSPPNSLATFVLFAHFPHSFSLFFTMNNQLLLPQLTRRSTFLTSAIRLFTRRSIVRKKKNEGGQCFANHCKCPLVLVDAASVGDSCGTLRY